MSNRLQQELLRPRKWFEASDNGDTEIFHIFDVIGADFWGDGVRPIDFVKAMTSSKKQNIEIHINSPGGDACGGITIYNELLRSGKTIKTVNVGMAASAASLIFMSGSERIMARASMVMIHRGETAAWGNVDTFKSKLSALEIIDDQMAGIYAKDSGGDKKKFHEMMVKETYMSVDDAIDLNISTGVDEDLKIAACAWDLKILSGLPEGFHKLQNAMNKRDIEAVLRDAGWSHSEAKRIAAGPREAENTDAEIIAQLHRNIEQLKTK